jgi:hypothetical protein
MNLRLRVLLVASAAALAAVVAAMLVVLPAAARDTGNRLDARVVLTNPGPLPACSDSCTDANITRFAIYVENGNTLVNASASGPQRADIRNAFAVSSIDQAVFVDGVQHHEFDFTYTPPPYPSFQPGSGHWPVSAVCPPEGPPCNVVGSPAILPGEEAVLYYQGWIHAVGEANGTYVFQFAIHGTLNGTAVTLRASSPPIVMTA